MLHCSIEIAHYELLSAKGHVKREQHFAVGSHGSLGTAQHIVHGHVVQTLITSASAVASASHASAVAVTCSTQQHALWSAVVCCNRSGAMGLATLISVLTECGQACASRLNGYSCRTLTSSSAMT